MYQIPCIHPTCTTLGMNPCLLTKKPGTGLRYSMTKVFVKNVIPQISHTYGKNPYKSQSLMDNIFSYRTNRNIYNTVINVKC
jgi:hypothetical protein